MDLEEERDDRKDRSEGDQPPQVSFDGESRKVGIEPDVKGHAQPEENDASDQLVQQHGGAVLPRGISHPNVQDGKNGIDCGGEQSQRYAQAVSDIQAEYQQDARYGYETDEEILPGEAVAVDGRVEERRKEAGSGDAGYSYRDVGSLDAGIERHPVYAQQGAASRDADDIPQAGLLQPVACGNLSKDKYHRCEYGQCNH